MLYLVLFLNLFVIKKSRPSSLRCGGYHDKPNLQLPWESLHQLPWQSNCRKSRLSAHMFDVFRPRQLCKTVLLKEGLSSKTLQRAFSFWGQVLHHIHVSPSPSVFSLIFSLYASSCSTAAGSTNTLRKTWTDTADCRPHVYHTLWTLFLFLLYRFTLDHTGF